MAAAATTLQQLLRQRPACERPALLTAAIKACSSWQQAALLFADHSHEFNHVHTAALISHLPKVLARQQPLSQHDAADVAQLLADLVQLAEEVLPACGPRELANMAQGLAAGGCYSRRLMQLLLGRCVLSGLRPQELANLAWAVAKTGHQVHEGWTAELLQCASHYLPPRSSSSSSAQGLGVGRVDARPLTAVGAATHVQAKQPWPQQQQQQQRLEASACCFKPQELANLAWALAVMQQQCMQHSVPPLRHSCTRVDAAWKQQLCAAAAAQLGEFNAADLSMVLWALAVLGGGDVLQRQQQQGWLDGLLSRAVQLAGALQGRHIAVLLWSASQLQRQQQHVQQQRQAQHQAHHNPDGGTTASSSGGSRTVHALAAACFPRLQQLLPSERQQLRLCCVVLLAAGHLQLQPPPAALQDLLQAAAQQLQQRSSISGASVTSSQQQQGVSFHDVTILLYGLAKLQYRPSGHFLAAADNAAATACWQLLLGNKHRKQQQQQGQIPPPPAAAAAPLSPVTHVRVKDISLLLWALGRLAHQPSPKLLRLLCKAAAARLHAASASDVGLMLWGLARLRARPRHAWLQAVLGHLLSRLDDSVHAAPAVANALSEGRQLQQLAGAARARFGECGPRELVALLQGFAGLGFSPGAGWLAEHQQRCEQLGCEGFSEREAQLLVRARAALVQLQQQQQAAGPGTKRVPGREQQQRSGGGLQGMPDWASPAGTADQPEQHQVQAAVLAALVH
ncbi:hypothetical protein COO60DRAFT_1704388 [Scenedesmus sp. NREL 46B-D3]|nr:hypothetical protein COO60DRAFT_1704388 [Scenedesmus sp. NREL 46B-D3]